VATPEYVIVGRVRKAHGIRGEVVVEPLTDAPEVVFASGRRVLAGTVTGHLDPDASALEVRMARPFKGGWIIAFDAITDRNDADLWRERYLFAPAAELAPPGEQEVYYHDLLGMQVRRASGEILGEVEALYELPQGLMLDVRRESGTVMLPYVPDVITQVDVDRRIITADPPEGLLD
jgi:16S rRNA processing protein RimM